MNPIGALILLAVILVVFGAPRRFALLGVLAGALFLTQGQSIDIGGFNIFAMRFVEMAAFARVVSRRELADVHINRVDRMLLVLYLYTTAVFLLRSSVDFAFQIGMAVDAILLYFSFRGLIKNFDDVHQFSRDFVFLLAPFAFLLLIESFTSQNPFAFMGGVSFGDWTREGRVRCFGSFRNPSLLGTLGATFAPLYFGLWLNKVDRKIATVGGLICLFIVWASNSGGPLNCLVFGVFGWMAWPMRRKMRTVRWGLVLAIIALALVMKSPIWYLPARVSAITGGTGWHRSYLMDMAAQHVSQWGLAGMPIKETGPWFPYQLTATGGADITNQYLSFGIAGGLLAMTFLILLVSRAFSTIGQAMLAIRQQSTAGCDQEFLVWGLGAVLTAHAGNWIGISYFDQTIAIWLFHLAAISNLTQIEATLIDSSGPTESVDSLSQTPVHVTH